jgi:hypothetical protein
MPRQADGQIEIRQKVADSFDAELRSALAGTVWHSGCTNWYVDEHDPNRWPWTFRTTAGERPESIQRHIRSARPRA